MLIKYLSRPVAGMTCMIRQEEHEKKLKRDCRGCVFSVKYSPKAPDLRKIVKKHAFVLDGQTMMPGKF